jgi:thioredoxin 2
MRIRLFACTDPAFAPRGNRGYFPVMGSLTADSKGVLVRCSACGQTNRLLFERFGSMTRCGKCKTDLPHVDAPVEASDPEVFSGLMTARVPVLIDFWAEWCGPCKMMSPELDRFARQSAGRIAVAKINTEGAPALAAQFQISAIPTLALFVNGREVGRVQGARSSAQLGTFVDQALQSKAA